MKWLFPWMEFNRYYSYCIKFVLFDFMRGILYNYHHNCKGAEKICIGQIK